MTIQLKENCYKILLREYPYMNNIMRTYENTIKITIIKIVFSHYYYTNTIMRIML